MSNHKGKNVMSTTSTTSFSAFEAATRMAGHHARLRPARELAIRSRRSARAQRRDGRA